jgi:hypothetical protein
VVVKELDPSTTTPAEMAQAARSLRQAKWTAIVVGLVGGALAWRPIVSSDLLDNSGLAVFALMIATVGVGRITYEVLIKVLPPN